MKLRNKKTGEIKEYGSVGAITFEKGGVLEGFSQFDSIKSFNEEWEDYEEPKGFWSINGDATIEHFDRLNENDLCKEIGNYFETPEEAEKAVERLKAWKRLKDNSFRFVDLRFEYDELGGTIKFKTNLYGGINDDLDLLFGGEE